MAWRREQSLEARVESLRTQLEMAEQRVSEVEARVALTFADLSAANRSRAERWHPGFPTDNEWTLADWSNAMCGEAGELANVVKKLRRHECGLRGAGDSPPGELRAQAAEELADTIIYADLVATKLGIDLASAIVDKFNNVSERQGFPERLGHPEDNRTGQ